MIEVLDIKENTCGIYCLLNKGNNKRYIGLSRDILKRIISHQQQLNNQTHYNNYLQASYLKNPFVAVLVQECSPEKLKEYEMFWIKTYKTDNRENGYNLTHGGEDLGNLTDEAKERKRLNRIGKSSSLKGKKQSEDWVEARMVKLRGQKRNYTEAHINAIKESREQSKGSRKKGKLIIITNNDSGEVLKFASKREAEDFLGIARDKLIHKFYKGRPRIILKKINYLNYTIERT
jgi:group I intron endonuclease